MDFDDQHAINWLLDDAFPFWAANGIDYRYGGVHEALDHAGQPMDFGYKRLRVLPRQIYSFAYAKLLGWKGDVEPILDKCVDTLIETGWHHEGGFIHRYNTDGSVNDDTRMLYDQSFVLLAFAALHKTGRETLATQWAERILSFIDEVQVDERNGGYFETPDRSGERTANSHMHLLEAMLEWYETTGNPNYLERARLLIDLFRTHLFDEEFARVHEFLDYEWKPLDPSKNLVEPGHHYEWVWLLLKYARLSGDNNLLEHAKVLFSNTLKFGHFEKTDSVAQTMRFDGSEISAHARLWSQTEGLKAALSMEETRLIETHDLKQRMLDQLFGNYLNTPVSGGWYDCLDQAGDVVSETMPSSSFYHIVCAFCELHRVGIGGNRF